MRKIKYKVEKSAYPEENKTHLVIKESISSYGYNLQRVFKGTKQECLDKKRELE